MAKANRALRQDEDADMGIGTLIIFIALVLVAAVAATLIISVAGELQQQAQHTAAIARQDVSSGFQVVSVVGDRGMWGTNASKWPAGGTNYDDYQDNWASTIEILELKVKLHAGSDPIDMDRVIIEVSDGYKRVAMSLNGNATNSSYCQGAGNDTAHVVGNGYWDYADLATRWNDPNQVLDDHYSAELLQDPTEHAVFKEDHVVTQGTLVKVYINCNAMGLNMNNQRHVTIKIAPKHGTPTLEEFTTPSAYVDRYVDLV